MKKTYLTAGGITLLAAAVLVGCNSNDEDNVVASNLTQAPVQKAQVTITPSLGKILNAKVILRNARTSAILGSGNTGNTGIATFTATKTSDPVIAEVQGQAGAKYFDESKKAEVDFGTGQIRVALPTFTTSIGVSALTEIAYQAAFKKAGSNAAITSAIAEASNEAIRKALAPELSSITVAPTLVGGTADLSLLANTDAGKYALKLAALAELAKADAAPALAILNQLAADIQADDKLDGVGGSTAITFYSNGNLVSKVSANINNIITAENLSGVGFNVSLFNPVTGSLTINVGGTGAGAGSGQNCALNANYNMAGMPFSYTVCYTNFPQNSVCGAGNEAFSSASIPGYAGSISWTYSQVATCPAGSIEVKYVD